MNAKTRRVFMTLSPSRKVWVLFNGNYILNSRSEKGEPMKIDQADLGAVQRLRMDWNFVPDVDLQEIRKFAGDGVSGYQLWIELRLAYSNRMVAELAFERDAWAKLAREHGLR